MPWSSTCWLASACRAELALWTMVGRRVVTDDRGLPGPDPSVLGAVLARVHRDSQRRNGLANAWQLLCAQVPLVRREIWSASAAIIAIGCLLTLSLRTGSAGILVFMAPLIAAASVAMIYGPENDPALELALATPTSPRQILLARLCLVFGYDLLLALAASLALVWAGGLAYALGDLVLSWLGPMAFLSALALALSVCIGANNAATAAILAWLARWGAYDLANGGGPVKDLQSVLAAATAINGAAGNSLLLFGLAAILLVLAFWLVGRPNVPNRTLSL